MDDDEPVDRTFQNSKALITFGVWLVLMAIGIAVWRCKKNKPSKRDERMKKYQRLNDVEAPHTSAKNYSDTTDTSQLNKFKEGIRAQFRYLSSDSHETNLASDIASSLSVETLYSNTYQEVMNDLIKLDEDTKQIEKKIDDASQSESDKEFARRLKNLQLELEASKDFYETNSLKGALFDIRVESARLKSRKTSHL